MQRGRQTLIVAAILAVTPGAGAISDTRRVELDRDEGPQFAAPQAISADVGRGMASVSISLDGRFIAFASDARLVSGDTNTFTDIYVLDRVTSAVTLESVASDNAAADDRSGKPGLSGDGRFLVFESSAGNLEARRDENGWPDVFLRDRQTRCTRRISVGRRDEKTDGPSREPAMSADGRWIAFSSSATNLVEGPDANGGGDIYLYEVQTGALSRASVSDDGTQPALGASFAPALSGDGSVLAFASTADFGAAATGCAASQKDDPRLPHVYARNNGQRRLVCVDAHVGDSRVRGRSHSPSLSPDGRHVAFVFDGGSVGQGRGSVPQVHLHDLARSSTLLASRSGKGGPGNGGSWRPALSATGRFLVFESLASNLECAGRCPVEGTDVNLLPDIYLLDVETGKLRRLSTGGGAGEWWAPSVAPAIDGSGRLVVFSSRQPRTPWDVDTGYDVFLWAAARGDGER
jgi:Tol biopolymer transport system component